MSANSKLDGTNGMKIPALIGIFMIASLASAAQAQYFEKGGGKRHVLHALGKEAVSCGVFLGSPYATGRSLTADQVKAVSDCATAARKARHAWFYAVEGSAVDSWVATGLMGDRRGLVRVFVYDSAPCGGPRCGESFEVYECPQPTKGAIDPLVVCKDEFMPQPTRR